MKNSNNLNLVIISLILSILGCSCGRDEKSSPKASKLTEAYTTPLDPIEVKKPTPIDPSNAKQLVFAKVGDTVVLTENKQLRSANSKNAKIIQDIPAGTSVDIIKEEKLSFFVRTGNQYGWIKISIDDKAPKNNASDLAASEPEYNSPNSSSPGGYSSPGYAPKTVYVRGYTRKNGTYVAPYMRSRPRR